MPNRKKTTLGVVHVTATSPKTNLTMTALKAMHVARGWSDTGYNEVIFRDGRAEISGRGANGIGAHVAGFNSISYGISLEGGVDRNNKADFATITAAQKKTLERRMKEISKQYPGIKWCGHRDLSPDKNGNGIIEPYEWLKECPTFDVIPYAVSIGVKPADIKGTWKVAAPVPGAEIATVIGPDSRDAYLQRLLSRAGYEFGPVDGMVGAKTTAAIKRFQTAHGLPITGKFDVKTVALLRKLFEQVMSPAPAVAVVPVSASDGKVLKTLGPDALLGNDDVEEMQAAAVQTPADAGQVVKSSLLGGILAGAAGKLLVNAIERVVDQRANNPDSGITVREKPGLVEDLVVAATKVVADQIAPKAGKVVEQVATNASNNEPWYKSRVLIGTGISLVFKAAVAIGVVSDAVAPEEITTVVMALVSVGGDLYALYGRLFAKSLKPIGE